MSQHGVPSFDKAEPGPGQSIRHAGTSRRSRPSGQGSGRPAPEGGDLGHQGVRDGQPLGLGPCP